MGHQCELHLGLGAFETGPPGRRHCPVVLFCLVWLEGPRLCRLVAGARWIRTIGTAKATVSASAA